MAADNDFPVNQRYFTIADLAALGLTYYKINKLVENGHLIRLGKGRYENAGFEESKQQENTHCAGEPEDIPVWTFLPAMMASDIRGVRRSVTHYVVPNHPDALQLVNIGVESTTPGYSFGPAVRDYEQMHFVLAGKGNVTIGRQRLTVQAGQIFYTPKDIKWYYESDDKTPWEYVWIGFVGEWAKRLIDNIGMNHENLLADIPDMRVASNLREELVRTMSMNTSYIAMMPIFWKFIQELTRVRGYAPNVKTRLETFKEKQQNSRIAEIVRRLEREYMNEISVNEIARDLSVSRAWLSRSFKAMTGKTIKEYVTDLRISHAKDLLTQTPFPISEVAAACGYQNPLFFSRMFKQVTGVSPTEWREQCY